MLQGRKWSVLCVCCCDCDRGAVLVVCVVVVVLWCARWSSLALIGVQKHRGVLVCRRGHRKHDNDPQSGGTGAGKYRQNKRQRKFLTEVEVGIGKIILIKTTKLQMPISQLSGRFERAAKRHQELTCCSSSCSIYYDYPISISNSNFQLKITDFLIRNEKANPS